MEQIGLEVLEQKLLGSCVPYDTSLRRTIPDRCVPHAIWAWLHHYDNKPFTFIHAVASYHPPPGCPLLVGVSTNYFWPRKFTAVPEKLATVSKVREHAKNLSNNLVLYHKLNDIKPILWALKCMWNYQAKSWELTTLSVYIFRGGGGVRGWEDDFWKWSPMYKGFQLFLFYISHHVRVTNFFLSAATFPGTVFLLLFFSVKTLWMTVTILAFLIFRLLGCLLGVSIFLSVSTRGDLWQAASGQYTLSYSKMVFTTDNRVHRLAVSTFPPPPPPPQQNEQENASCSRIHISLTGW